ncbi:MAG: LicD family protein [Treponema sp.]|nr:LicD family protein [Treponema sp.]
MKISVFVRKARRKIKRNFKKIFCKKQILKEEISKLKYQLNYVTSHISPDAISPAIGYLRDYQLREVAFMKEILSYLNEAEIYPVLGGGGVLGLVRHNGFIPWDDDLDFDLMRDDFNRVIEYAKKNWVWVELKEMEHYYAKYYDDAIKSNPGKIIAIRTPYCLHVYRGTVLKDSVNVEFFMFDYVKDGISDEQMIAYKNKIYELINKKRRNVQEILDAYNMEFNNSSVFTKEKTDRIYYGIGNYALTEYKFHSILEYSDIFPPKDAEFEGVKVKIPNKPENSLKSLYGDWKKLPSDIGISKTIESMNEYFREYKQEAINYKD